MDGWMWPGLTYGTLILVSTLIHHHQGGNDRGWLQYCKPGGNVIGEGLNIILDNLAVQYIQMNPDGWLDISAWFIKEMNHVLDRSDFRRVNQII